VGSELTRSGFHGGLSWFLNYHTQPAILGPFFGTTITAPSMYIAGEKDLIAANPPALAKFPTSLPGLRGVHVVPDAGHWIQQETAAGSQRRPPRIPSLALSSRREIVGGVVPGPQALHELSISIGSRFSWRLVPRWLEPNYSTWS